MEVTLIAERSDITEEIVRFRSHNAQFIEALDNGQSTGAGLDVFGEEALRDNHPLLSFENVVLSPHVAYNTPEAVKAIFDITVQNICSYFEGEPINVVAAP